MKTKEIGSKTSEVAQGITINVIQGPQGNAVQQPAKVAESPAEPEKEESETEKVEEPAAKEAEEPTEPEKAEEPAENTPTGKEEAAADEEKPAEEPAKTEEPAAKVVKKPEAEEGSLERVSGVEDDDDVPQKPADSALKLDKDAVLAKLLIDPQGAVDEITQKVLDSVQKKQQDEEARTNAWKSFYKENADLAPFKETLVPLLTKQVIRQAKEKGEKLSAEEGFKRVAIEGRKLIKSIRDSDADIEEVTASGAPTISSSGSPAPHAVTGSGSGGRFADQVRSFQKKQRQGS